MTKNILIILYLSTALANLIANPTNSLETKIKIQNQKVVQLAAKEISKNLPQKIDNFTQLLKVKAENEKLVYIYEIKDPNKSDKEIIKEDKKRMKQAVSAGICKSSIRFLKSGIGISYIYNSARTKQKLFQFDIKKEDCVK